MIDLWSGGGRGLRRSVGAGPRRRAGGTWKTGYVSVDGARRDYGVVVREIDWEALEYELDLDATRAARRDMRAAAAAE